MASGFAITDQSFSSLDAMYDCASLYNRSYRISGDYKLPKDEFLGTPELDVSHDDP